MSTKRRLSASVDAELMAVAQEAVTEGHAESISAWVNDARDSRLTTTGVYRPLTAS
jgi:hypothetical protein